MIKALIAVLAISGVLVANAATPGKDALPKASPAAKPKATAKQATANAQSRPQAIDDTEISDEQMAIASRVLVGAIPCELGASVTLTPDVPSPGKFLLEFGDQHFIMHPVPSSTGAIRLESHWAGAVWLQVANKSMLVSDKSGSRLADGCVHAEQAAFAAQAAHVSPSILD